MFDLVTFSTAKAVQIENGDIIETVTNKVMTDPKPITSDDDLRFPDVTTNVADHEIVLLDSSDNMPYIVTREEAMSKGVRYPVYV